MTITEIVDGILSDNDVDDVLEAIDDAKSEFVTQETLDEFDGDLEEAYAETGRGEAESQVLQEVIDKFYKENNLSAYTTEEYADIAGQLKDSWDISTN